MYIINNMNCIISCEYCQLEKHKFTLKMYNIMRVRLYLAHKKSLYLVNKLKNLIDNFRDIHTRAIIIKLQEKLLPRTYLGNGTSPVFKIDRKAT